MEKTKAKMSGKGVEAKTTTTKIKGESKAATQEVKTIEKRPVGKPPIDRSYTSPTAVRLMPKTLKQDDDARFAQIDLEDMFKCMRERGQSAHDYAKVAGHTISLIYAKIDSKKEFIEGFVRARELLLDYWANELHTSSAKAIEDALSLDIDPKSKNAYIQAVRLDIDTKKWIMSKLAPQKWGDFVRAEITGKDGKDLENNSYFVINAMTAKKPDLEILEEIDEND